jgi:BirA family biotin operon repressor/biotin-[acetyl-CoA-carboxylase] ligase
LAKPAVKRTLEPQLVEPLLRGRFGRPYRYVPQCPSTQLELDEASPEGATAVCELQTAGRGRLGRRWEAPEGTALHCSIALRPPQGRRVAELTLAGAVAAAEAIEAVARVEPLIKWPNDLLLYARKVAGVLGELRGDTVILGIGINVNQTEEQLPAQARQRPASLRTVTGREEDRAPLLAELLLKLEDRYDAWCEHGLEALHQELVRRDFLRGRDISVDGVAGRACGIDARGRLELDVRGVRRFVESGEVAYL